MFINDSTFMPCPVVMPEIKKFMIVQQTQTRQLENSRLEVVAEDWAKKNQTNCLCVYCDDDHDCGGLWEGSVAEVNKREVPRLKGISLVIAHCLHDLHWMQSYIKGFEIADIVIFSKCGHPVRGAPEDSRVVQLPNVGRNDHNYAHYMNLIYDKHNQDSEVFLFIKDDFHVSNSLQPHSLRSLRELLIITHELGFACGRELGRNPLKLELSTYHYTPLLADFSLSDYERGRKRYNATIVNDEFPSKFENLSDFMNYLDYSFPKLTQVCYRGNFATTRQSIQRHPKSLWYNLEKSLSRANNLEEGHFMERSWQIRSRVIKWKLF